MNLRLSCRAYATSRLPTISRQFSFLGKMNRNSKNQSARTGNSAIPRDAAGANGSPLDVSAGTKGGRSHAREHTSEQMIVENVSEQPKVHSASDSDYEKIWPTLSASIGSSSKGKRRTRIDLRTQLEQNLEDRARGIDVSQPEISSFENSTVHNGNSDCARRMTIVEPFDICLSDSGNMATHEAPPHAESREVTIEMDHSMEETRRILRPGMVLLKTYIPLTDQVEIVKKCRDLGLGPGGFYQPGYKGGAKLRLKMMCLGLNWDPETRKYDDLRPIDSCKPPGIPQEFILLVEKAIQESHSLIKEDLKESNVEDILPGMSANVCIVNFYSSTGRLGLHQDRDESTESLRRRLPVVSFSIGDSAEFIYGDQRNVDKAEKVLLESGDVLIFGGMARHIFHGVTSIIPGSAPAALLDEVKLHPGRLNLTFRQS